MFRKECKLLAAGLFATFVFTKLFAQQKSSWQMQPVALQTRWAKNVNHNHPLPEYPRPQIVRSNWQNLNGLWQYAVTEKTAGQPSNYDGNILVPFPIESALSGVKKRLFPSQFLWYKRTFQAPIVNGKKTLIHFGAVDWQTTVFVNGSTIGTHTGGYTAFTFDITSALKSGNNELVVKVYDPTDQGIGPHGKQVLTPGNIYYTPSSGIWQTVWLEQVPETYISSLKITTDIDRSLVTITPQVSSTRIDLKGLTAEILIKDGNRLVCRKKEQVGQPIVLPIKTSRLWSPDDPFLYDISVRLLENGKVGDEVKSYFGMRKIDIQKDSNGIDRIFLNNKYTYNLGTLDQGFWPDGLYTAPTDEALAFDIKACKAMGFNTIRKHIKVEPSRWYYHADRLGMLVWQDFVNPNQRLPEGAKEAFEQQTKETIDQLYNFPCITTWVIFNEKWGQYDQQRITEWVKNVDSSRIINGHSGELLYVNNELRSPSSNPYISADMTDVHSYPFPRMAVAQPDKAMVVGEFGGIGVPIEDHLWDDLVAGWGYDGVVKPQTMQKQYTQMMDSLKILEKQGLSASIYTQPFDVESEQNGLMTYDRAVIKLPVDTLRNIHARLWLPTKNLLATTSSFSAEVASPYGKEYADRIKDYDNGRKDSAFLRTLVIVADLQNDKEVARRAVNHYLSNIKNIFSETNLRFIRRYTYSTNDLGFSVLYNNLQKVNHILGNDQAENAVKAIIAKNEIEPYVNDKMTKPDWHKISERVKKYGIIGMEKVYGAQMIYYREKRDWENYGKYYALYYQTAYSHSEYHINNMSWPIFEHVTDTSVLNIAVETMAYSLEHFDQANYQAYDTYANLLHKVGRTKEAIEWQEKAAKALPNDKGIAEALIKMKKGLRTWN